MLWSPEKVILEFKLKIRSVLVIQTLVLGAAIENIVHRGRVIEQFSVHRLASNTAVDSRSNGEHEGLVLAFENRNEDEHTQHIAQGVGQVSIDELAVYAPRVFNCASS